MLRLFVYLTLTFCALLLTAAAPTACGQDTANQSASNAAASAKIERRLKVFVKGLSGPMLQSVLRAVELRSLRERLDASDAQIQLLYGRAPGQIRKALEPFGYYNPNVKANLAVENDVLTARFQIDLGPQVKVTELNIDIDAAAAKERRVARAVRRFHPRVGEGFDHVAYEASKINMLRSLSEQGYLDVSQREAGVKVRRQDNTAIITLALDVGPRYKLGKATIAGGQMPDEFMQRFLPYEVGDFYTQKKLLELQRRLLDSEYFSSVEVAADVEAAVDNVVPITINLQQSKRNVYTGGLSLGTDSGVGARAAVERRWVNKRGHKMRIETEFSQRLRGTALQYQIPVRGNSRAIYSFNASYRDEQSDSARTKAKALSLARVREAKDWTRTLSFNYLSGDFEVANVKGNSSLIYPEIRLLYRQADDLIFPEKGFSFSLEARTGARNFGSDTSFAAIRGELRGVYSLADDTRVLLRGVAGALSANNFAKLPPPLRFFAGGDRSLRGYNYQELGPRDAAGKVLGGHYLLLGSAEYEKMFNETWGAAAFIDAGNAFDTGSFGIKRSAGIGLRWKSPVGLVRLDYGRPIGDGSGGRFHLVIGPDL
jgi:translocation and assembly module TamA